MSFLAFVIAFQRGIIDFVIGQRVPSGKYIAIKPPVFSLIFLSHMVKENQAVTVYRSIADEGEGRILPKSVLGSQKTEKTIFSRVRYLFLLYYFFYFFLPDIKFMPQIGG